MSGNDTTLTFGFQEEIAEKEKKPKKPKSKVAAAKKLLNKNVKTNTKIVFDDEGEVTFKLFGFGFCLDLDFWIMWIY